MLPVLGRVLGRLAIRLETGLGAAVCGRVCGRGPLSSRADGALSLPLRQEQRRLATV